MADRELKPEARFLFVSPELTLEFQGTEAFVTEQMERVRSRVRTILRSSATAATAEAEAEEEDADKRPSLEELYLKAKTREGRGALQDSIVLFAHYMQKYQSKLEFSIDDLNFCFDLLNIRRPKSLANTLGIIKRDRKLLHSGSRRGTYALSEGGKEKVRRLLP